MPNTRVMTVAAVGGLAPRKPETIEGIPSMPAKRTDELFMSVKSLAGFSASMLYLAEAGNDRLTINQAAFFLIAAAADLRGRPLSLAEIMEATEGVLNRSVANTYKVLLAPNSKDYRKIGLGWLTREPDPDDERRNFLVLTSKGRAVVRAALLALGRQDDTFSEGD